MGTGISTVNSLGLAGMQTAQSGMANVATNVAGASVDGFHRRQMHPIIASASTDPLVQGGTVVVDSIVRSFSALITSQYQVNHAKLNQAQSLNNASLIVDRMLVDESTGLTQVFNGFFTAASDLSADPASGTARTAFATTALELTDRVRNLASTIEETRRQALFQTTGVLESFNDKAQALARVNQLIQSSAAGGKPLPSADLLDERDRLVGELSDLMGVSQEVTTIGQATLRFDGIAIVEGGRSARLQSVDDPDGLPTGQIKVALPKDDTSTGEGSVYVATLKGNSLVGGEFGGLIKYAEGAESWLKSLDEFALSFVKFGDPLRASGNGATGQQWYSKRTLQDGTLAPLGGTDDNGVFYPGMFRVDPGYAVTDDSGSVVSVVRTLRPSLTFRSNVNVGTDVPWAQNSDPNAAVDQSFVTKMAGGRSLLMREWSDWVSGVSSDLSKWRAEEASYTAVDNSLNDQLEQISGVDLDEEATDLLRFQQIYQANSSVIQAAMRMFDTLLNVTSR
ncbi:MAG: flagellar hook-associated protein FlgK [Betaproteobacteria bacterium]|nr:flagellar hook-associated protein FlgK [Betaproteobacteria bacterium]